MPAPEDCQTLDQVRSEIDRVDRAIVELLAERRSYVKAVMRFKHTAEDVHAVDRQKQVIAARREWAEALDLSPELVERIYRTVIDHFVAEELDILSERSQS
ncbi:MAG: chorismate mutase [Caldilineaceae bacterium]